MFCSYMYFFCLGWLASARQRYIQLSVVPTNEARQNYPRLSREFTLLLRAPDLSEHPLATPTVPHCQGNTLDQQHFALIMLTVPLASN